MANWHDLGWLLPADENFAARLAAPELSAKDIKSLSGCKLNDRLAGKLARIARRRFAEAPDVAAEFECVRLAILTDSNLEFLDDMFFSTGLRFGLNVEIKLVEYTGVVSEAADPDSALYRLRPNFVLFANFGGLLQSIVANFQEDLAAAAAGHILSEAALVARSISQNSNAQFLVQTVAAIQPDVFGSLDRFQPGSLGRASGQLNSGLTALGFPIIDIEKLAARVGTYNWFNDGRYHWTKMPFDANYSALYCDFVLRKIAAAAGKVKKVLVLDLDNTLWGGVIGDDGLDNIKLGNNSPVGEAFLAGQRYYKMLKNRGVVLAVCSKNDMANALLPFEKHPEMLLKRDDITCFVANWQDKPGNIRAIAETLGLSADSFVFLDDNPAERNFVRSELPQVSVPEVPDHDASLYPRYIEAAGYFEAISFTGADALRAVDYKANADRAAAMAGSSDVESYLKSLDMRFTFSAFSAVDEDRITQLVNRSNQFNLTTRRYTNAEIAAITRQDSKIGFTCRLADKFSDSGLIAVLIVAPRPQACWEIDTWLMSCRVLGRKAEEATLYRLALAAKDHGMEALIGRYVATAKNGMVKDHYHRLKFTPEETMADGETLWRLDIDRVPELHPLFASLPFRFQ